VQQQAAEVLDSREEPLSFTGKTKPYIPANKVLPEITIKATILGVFLAIVMAGSNAYLALKVGMTVSATIPAAVLSMAILRLFKDSNILENNIVQTAASAGEVVAASVVFTLPALLMMGFWTSIPFYLTTGITIIGGLLGVLFSIPLRRAFVCENSNLTFPEGIATGEVLKAGDDSSHSHFKDLLGGGLMAAVIKFGQSGLMILEENIHYWVSTTRSVFGFGTGLSLVLVGAGYIVGANVGLSMLLGACIAWAVGVPLHGYLYGLPEASSAYDAAVTIWATKLRMMGVGAMVVGGVWTIIHLIEPIKNAVKSSLKTISKTNRSKAQVVMRTEHDIPITYVAVGIGVLSIPLFFIFNSLLSQNNMGLSPDLHWMTVTFLTVCSVALGFLCAAVAGYMSGLVGSSNNPLSGVTIMAILSVSMGLLVMLGTQLDFETETTKAMAAGAIAIMAGCVMANAGAISGDNLQDLKAGRIVGATPWKQQVMLMVGVLVGACVITPILQILYEAYGIGTALPREGMDPTQALAAPVAAMMASIAKGVFSQSIDWEMIGIGALIAVAVISIDEMCQRTNKSWRLPVLAVAVGIYFPLEVTIPVLIGGIISFFANRKLDTQAAKEGKSFEIQKTVPKRRGMLFASGVIAGEAIVGIALAVPFAASQSTDVFRIDVSNLGILPTVMGTALFSAVGYYLYRISSRVPN